MDELFGLIERINLLPTETLSFENTEKVFGGSVVKRRKEWTSSVECDIMVA